MSHTVVIPLVFFDSSEFPDRSSEGCLECIAEELTGYEKDNNPVLWKLLFSLSFQKHPEVQTMSTLLLLEPTEHIILPRKAVCWHWKQKIQE